MIAVPKAEERTPLAPSISAAKLYVTVFTPTAPAMPAARAARVRDVLAGGSGSCVPICCDHAAARPHPVRALPNAAHRTPRQIAEDPRFPSGADRAAAMVPGEGVAPEPDGVSRQPAD